MTPASPSPTLGVVVVIVGGPDAVRRCLRAVTDPRHPSVVDVVVPTDSERADVAVLAAEFDDVRFVDIGPLDAETDPGDPCADHERFDLRRSAGLREVRGDVVVMLEDHGVPDPGYFDAVLRAWTNEESGAVGGTVGCDAPDGIRRAAWIMDFGRHLPGCVGGSVDVLTDVNVSFRRSTIDAAASAWRNGYHEPRVHAALATRGGLRRSIDMTVTQRRSPTRASAFLAERRRWGRHFGRRRPVRGGRIGRILFAAAAFFLSPVFAMRSAYRAGARASTLRALPWILAGSVAWGLGEAEGVLDGIGRPESDAAP